MRSTTPATVRASTLGRLAALLLVALIVCPVTAPFSAISGSLEASPSGPADSVKGETTPTDAVVEVIVVHHDPSWCAVPFRAFAPTAIVRFTSINRVLRL